MLTITIDKVSFNNGIGVTSINHDLIFFTLHYNKTLEKLINKDLKYSSTLPFSKHFFTLSNINLIISITESKSIAFLNLKHSNYVIRSIAKIALTQNIKIKKPASLLANSNQLGNI